MAIQKDRTGGDAPRTSGRRWVYTAVAISGIWIAVILATLFAPGLVSGYWGLSATCFAVLVAVAVFRGGAPGATTWIALALTGAFSWTMLFLVSALGPWAVAAGVALLATLAVWALGGPAGRSSTGTPAST